MASVLQIQGSIFQENISNAWKLFEMKQSPASLVASANILFWAVKTSTPWIFLKHFFHTPGQNIYKTFWQLWAAQNIFNWYIKKMFLMLNYWSQKYFIFSTSFPM